MELFLISVLVFLSVGVILYYLNSLRRRVDIPVDGIIWIIILLMLLGLLFAGY